MSERDEIKNEMIRILDRIPTSGSFEAAQLAVKVSELSKKWLSLNSIPETEPSEKTTDSGKDLATHK
jgi:hypothetical protein